MNEGGTRGAVASSLAPPRPGFFSPFGSLGRRLLGGREAWALSDQALVSGANFLTNVTLARSLGPGGFGRFALCWMAVMLMSSLQTASIVLPMMSIGPKQEIAARPAYFGAVALQALLLAAGSAVLVALAALGCSALFPAWHAGALALPVAAATGAYLLQDFTRRYFFTISRNRMAMVCDALSYLSQLPVLWWLEWRGALTLPRALWVIAVTSLLSAAVSILWRDTVRLERGMMRAVWARHWGVVRWLAPSAVLQWTSLNMFVVFAPIYYGAAAAGALRACQNVVAVAHVWFLGLDNVMPSEAARQLHEHGVDAALGYLKKMLLRWGLVTLAFMLVVGVAPGFWLHLLYGQRYMQFGYVLRLYGVLYVMIFIGGPLRAGLQALEYTAPMLWSYTAMTLFSLVMAAPLAKQLGLRGVMLGLMATQLLFQAVLGAALLARCRRLRSRQPVLLQQ